MTLMIKFAAEILFCLREPDPSDNATYIQQGQPEGTGPQRGRWVVGQTAGARRILQSMGKDSEHQDYTVEVKDRQIGLNPFRWAIYRTGWPRAVKRTASVYRTAEKCRIAGTQALREFLSNIAKRRKKKNDG